SAITTAVGDGTDASGGDDGPGPSAQIRAPRAGVVGGFGDLYIADEAAAVIRRFSMSDGLVTTVAGNGDTGDDGDGGPATGASFNGPAGVALDGTGALVVA